MKCGKKRRSESGEWIRGSSMSWTEKNLYLTVTIVVMELNYGECFQDSHVVGLEVTITDER